MIMIWRAAKLHTIKLKQMNYFMRYILILVAMLLISVCHAQSTRIEIPPTPRPPMPRETLLAKRKFYESKYGVSRRKKVSGAIAESRFDCSANQAKDYAKWLSWALKQYPRKRYFKLKVHCSIPMATFE